METKKQTAVEWLAEQLEQHNIKIDIKNTVVFQQAKAMEREQHGNTWDAAIKAHDERGHVFVRSICDFDDYEVA
jgi:hypothetical protein